SRRQPSPLPRHNCRTACAGAGNMRVADSEPRGVVLRSECLAAGYLLALPFSAPRSEFSERVPPSVITASACFTDFVPDPSLLPRSGVSEVERTKRMNNAGVPLTVVREMEVALAASIGAGDYIFPVFRTLDAALAFKSRLLGALDVRVLGLGLPA